MGKGGDVSLQQIYEEGHPGHYVRNPKTRIVVARHATLHGAVDDAERRNVRWADQHWPVDVVSVPNLRPTPEGK